MKRLILLMAAVVAALGLAGAAGAAYDPDVDYLAIMMEAAQSGDYTTGVQAQEAREEKMESLGISGQSIDFQDLYLLAKVMYIEAGSEWLSDEWKMAVGEVVLNRVDSPEFPDTIEEVVYQKGQYAGSGNRYWESLMPSERCVELALRLLNGERNLEPSVVFQANFRQGSGVYLALYDRHLGWTYFCYSSHMYLYDEETVAEEENPADEEIVTEDPATEESPVEEEEAVQGGESNILGATAQLENAGSAGEHETQAGDAGQNGSGTQDTLQQLLDMVTAA